MRYLLCLFMVAAIAQPALGKVSPLAEVVTGLTRVSERLMPAASVEKEEQTVTLSYKPRTYTVHYTDKTGRHSEKAYEVVGPRYDGLIVRVTLQDGRYAGAAVLPQEFRHPYWISFGNAYPISKGKQHLHGSISYGSRTDRKLIKEVKAWLESMIDDDPNANAAKLRMHDDTVE